MGEIRILDDLAGSKLLGWCGLCNNEQLLSIPAEKVVDISGLCPLIEKGQAIIKYARHNGYLIAEIWNLEKKGKHESGGSVHFHLDRLTEGELAKRLYYCLVAENTWGVAREELARIVFEYAPKSNGN